MGRLKVISLTSILVATLDGIAAIVQFKLRGGDNPLQVFRFIASGIFGIEAFNGNIIYPAFGIVIHYLIATIWTTIFFYYYPKIQRFWMNKYAVGTCYALIIWCMMNLIVMPLSNTPPLPLYWSSALTEFFILVCTVGIPISLIYHSKMGSTRNIH